MNDECPFQKAQNNSSVINVAYVKKFGINCLSIEHNIYDTQDIHKVRNLTGDCETLFKEIKNCPTCEEKTCGR